MPASNVKIVVFVPPSHADAVREALGKAGAGVIGNYDYCTFSTRGVGRFRGNAQSHPVVGKAGVHESVEEERIETVAPRAMLDDILAAIKSVHPYEEAPVDIFPLENIP